MKKKATIILLIGCMMTSMLAGCSGSTKESEEVSSAESVSVETDTDISESTAAEASEDTTAFDPKTITEGVTLTIAIAADAMVEDYNTNEMTLAIEEALGVDLEFVTYASADYETKLNVMAMSGEELPDIIFNPGDSYTSWASEGAIISLNEFYENEDLSSNFWAASEAFDMDLYGMMKDADGEVYFIPYSTQNYSNMVSNKLWVYEPWLDELGVDAPETVEDFYEICKLVAATDLNGNGKQDEVALTGYGFTTDGNVGWFKMLMSAYVYAWGRNYLVADDGELSFAFTTDEWKEGLTFIKKFFDDGLIPVETLTQDNAQYEAIWKSDGDVMLFSFVFYHMGGTDKQRQSQYLYVPALTTPGGEEKTAYYSATSPSVGAVISVDCENPEAAFLVCDYMLNEEMSITNRYGKRGVNWDYWDEAQVEDPSVYEATYEGYDISFIAYDDVGFFSSQQQQNVAYIQKGPFLQSANLMNGIAIRRSTETEEEQWTAEFESRKNAAILDSLEHVPDEVVPKLKLTADESEKTSDIQTSLNTYFYEATCAFLVGEKDIEQEWDSYLAELEKIGCQELLEIYQNAYDRMNQ